MKYALKNAVILDGTKDMEPLRGQSVLVEGERYAWAVTPDADGKLYLWLKRPGEGMQWTATVTEGTMTLRQTAKAPSGDAGSITPGERNTLKSGTVYTLSGDIAEGTVLEIMESGVTVILDGGRAV